MVEKPKFVRVQLENDTWIFLEHFNDEKWASQGQNLQVALKKVDANTSQVLLQAGETRIKRVQITWEIIFEDNTRILTDAFERGYGDLAFQPLHPDKKMPWYFIAESSSGLFGCGVKTNCNSLCQWYTTTTSIDLLMDVRSGTDAINLGGRMLDCGEIVMHAGQGTDSFKFAVAFCQALASEPTQLPEQIYGGNDWYYAYGHSSAKLISEITNSLSEMSAGLDVKPFMVIDDGWQINRTDDYNGGPWNTSNHNFPSMPELAREITAKGVRPGLWFRPLLEKKTADVTPEMILKKESDNLILDPSHPDVLKKISRDLQRFSGWGFELVKHDFSTYDIFGQWGFEMGDDYFLKATHFYDNKKTTAEIINQFYCEIRKASPTLVLIGCNTIGHLSVGRVDIQRTGDDTSGRDFNRTRKMGVNTLAFRMPQNNTFFKCDADCVGITKEIAWADNKKWLDILSKSGTPLFISFNPAILTDEMKNDIIHAFNAASTLTQSAVPLDWNYAIYPEKWQTQRSTENYQWYSSPRNFYLGNMDKE